MKHLAIAAWCVVSAAAAQTTPAPNQLTLTLRVEGTRVELLDASTSSVPQPSPSGAIAGGAVGKDEGPIALLDAAGHVLGSYSVEPRDPGFDFLDMPDPRDPDRLVGGVRFRGAAIVEVTLPLDPRATALRIAPGLARPLPAAPRCPPCPGKAIRLHPVAPALDPAKAFDLLIVGDGFQDSEQALLRKRAEELAAGLLEIEPFSEFRDSLQIQFLPLVSNDSGISHCPFAGVEKDTWLRYEGHWDGAGYPCYVGTTAPHRLDCAVSCALPPGGVDATIVLIHTAMRAGHADRDRRIAYVANTVGPGFIRTAAHELGHVIGALGDEYLGLEVDPSKPLPRFPNIATLAQVRTGSVPWRCLEGVKKNRDGQFAVVHDYPGRKTDPCVEDPEIHEYLRSFVGLFWGATFVDRVADAQCEGDSYGDPRGADYYRPQARCTMRYLAAPFCEACAEAVRRGLASPGTTPDPDLCATPPRWPQAW